MTVFQNAVISLKCQGISPHKVIHKIAPDKLDEVDQILDEFWSDEEMDCLVIKFEEKNKLYDWRK